MNATDTASLSGRTARPLDVTRLGFGGAPLGNLYRKISEEDAQATLRAAHACGVRLFDTAPYYGLGRSEERFGTAIESFGRETIVLSHQDRPAACRWPGGRDDEGALRRRAREAGGVRLHLRRRDAQPRREP